MVDILKISRRDAVKLLGTLVAATAAPQTRPEWKTTFAELANLDKNYLWWEPIRCQLVIDRQYVDHFQEGDFVSLHDTTTMRMPIPCMVMSIDRHYGQGKTFIVLKSIHADVDGD